MIRTTKKKTIAAAGTPQPAFGSQIAAAVVAWNGFEPRPVLSLQVADSSDFNQGDWCLLIEADGTLGERHKVLKVVDSTHIQIFQPSNAHAITGWAVVSNQAASFYLQTVDGNAGDLYIGSSVLMVKATMAKVMVVLKKVAAATQPYDFSSAKIGEINVSDTAEYWIDGTTNDTFLPSFTTI